MVKTIACIDDDPAITDYVKVLLEHDGNFRVHSFNSGKSALESLGSLQPDVILLDMVMPEMDGIEVLKKIKEYTHTASIPVIFITAQKTSSDIDKYMNMGALSVLVKPFDAVTLADQIDMLSKTF